jgi:2-polyprenyl-6-methoxyphenol hydroxylase-like FAD-dependent oxidoreductase
VKIVINGAGVAGPMLAYWLRKSNHDVLLVEQAPVLRTGGYIIDFWGSGYDLAEKMGILPRVLELGYLVKEVRFVNSHGRKVGGFPADVFGAAVGGRYTSVRRTDIAATIYGALDSAVETMYGDSIAGLQETSDGVHVTFDRAAPRDVDLVVGADGLHSRVRELAFGHQTAFEHSLGYHVAAFEVDGYRCRDELTYVAHAVPGRAISRFSMRDDKTLILCVFQDKYMNGGRTSTLDERKAMISSIFSNLGWESRQILAAMDDVSDVYFDGVTQIRMDHWSRGRTALVGDAAACVSLLAGEGTGLAMAEAYVLAGELCACGGPGDYAAAFARYEARMKPFIEGKQGSAAKFASSFAPTTALGIAFRNAVTRLFAIRPVAEFFVGRELRDNLVLPDYWHERLLERS